MKNYLAQKAVRVERIDQKITSVIKKSAWDKKIRKKFITADNKMTAVDVGDWLLKKHSSIIGDELVVETKDSKKMNPHTG